MVTFCRRYVHYSRHCSSLLVSTHAPQNFQPCTSFARCTPAPPLSSSSTFADPLLVLIGRRVRAGPGSGPAGPAAGRPPHGAPARPGQRGGRDRGGRDQPTRRPARPTTQTVENALRTGVLGCVCAHGRSPRHPGRGRQLAGGVAPTGRIGVASAGPLHNQLQRPWNPSTTSFSSAGGKRRLRALESL